MKKNLTELIILCDRSGSMNNIKVDIEGALSELIKKQSNIDGECLFTFYQFDKNDWNDSEKILDKIYESVSINNIKKIEISPRGTTPLNDAICMAIDEVGVRLSNTKEEDRPERVLFFVISDGEENSSKTYTGKDVKTRVDHQTNMYKWKIEFLGCNFDAIAAGTSLGVNVGSAITFNSSTQGIYNAIGSLSNKICSYRAMDCETYMTSTIDYTEDERKQAGQ